MVALPFHGTAVVGPAFLHHRHRAARHHLLDIVATPFLIPERKGQPVQ
jgi:hypothetical protein